MPNYIFKEVWSPLKLIGVRFYRDDDNNLWVKMWSKQRRRVG
ncbi:hypothetical protein [Paenibacillus sp. CF384]|nr:hypothetical protein [Paenibacillus sp. CF384]SDX27146.1 hypothetical protein SAMN05518855_101198 [Paenibacillus sp. CF384]